MAAKSVVWTVTAIRQRRQVFKYWTIRNKSTAYAEKLLFLIGERVKLIAENPSAGKPTSHSEMREVAMGNFSIYYKINAEKITITSFWDNRQNPENLIKLLRE